MISPPNPFIPNKPPPDLDERTQAVLRGLIERYIRDGRPVGSRVLSRDLTLGLSPASIRNLMADLEDLGLITSPHVSAGRIPTQRGYRLFVDSLLKIEPLSADELQRLRAGISSTEEGARGITTQASRAVASITRMAGLVSVPRRNAASWRHIEFLRLSDHRVLAILVQIDNEVQNRVLEFEQDYSEQMLNAAAGYLNGQFSGRTLADVRAGLLMAMRMDMHSMNEIVQAALAVGERLLSEGSMPDPDFMLAGQTNLMGVAELADVDRLKSLFEAFSDKRDILNLLDRALAAPGVQVFIGEESGYAVLGDLSIVTASYGPQDRPLGVVGVIGPTRMAYQKVIPVVDVTARLLGSALNDGGLPPQS